MNFYAFDFETTGAAHFHGDMPFMLCITFENRKQITYEWFVDPTTRKVIYDINDVVEIVQLVQDITQTPVGHNVVFDVRCIDTMVKAALQQLDDEVTSGHSHADEIEPHWIILQSFSPESLLDRCHDTMLMSHALDNLGSHGLKDLAVEHLDLGESDVIELKQQVEECRKVAETLGWKIASSSSMPHMKKAPKDGWWVMDMWLSHSFATLLQHEERLEHIKLGHQSYLTHSFKNLCAVYCLRDTERTLRLFFLLAARLQAEGLWDQYLRNQVCLAPTYNMSSYGVSLKYDTLESEQKRFHALSNQYDQQAKKLCGLRHLNLNSPEQKAMALASFDVLVPRRTADGKLTVNQDELETLLSQEEEKDEPNQDLMDFLFALLARGKCSKVADGDITNYKMKAVEYEDGHYLHPSINLTGTGTTRTSFSDPNLQNVGKGKDAFNDLIRGLDLSLRKLFGPVAGRRWWAIDYKQLQVVIAAQLSQEPAFLQAIARGDDLHDFIQRKICDVLRLTYDPNDEGQRTLAKGCNFGYLFGAGENKINTTTHSKGLYPVLIQTFPHAHAQIKKDIKQAKELGYVKASGYRLFIPESTPYAATVYKIQGWEGVIAKNALRKCYDYQTYYKDADIHLILIIHDELVFDVPEDCDLSHLHNLARLMVQAGTEEGMTCTVNAKIITTNWAEGKKYELPMLSSKT